MVMALLALAISSCVVAPYYPDDYYRSYPYPYYDYYYRYYPYDYYNYPPYYPPHRYRYYYR
jgi:hypothetical protein